MTFRLIAIESAERFQATGVDGVGADRTRFVDLHIARFGCFLRRVERA